MSKICTVCKLAKELSKFYNNSSQKDGKDYRCIACKKVARKKDYEKHSDSYKRRASQWKKDNPEKRLVNNRRWTNMNREKDRYIKRVSAYMVKYGLSIEAYNQLFAQQAGCCAICKKHQSELKKGLVVDHKHIEGYKQLPPEEKVKYVRGLLCELCNIGLGSFIDDPVLTNNATHYLTN
jgi:hypothetical protein